MDTYKKTVYIAIVITSLSFCISRLFWECNTRIGDYISNLFIGVFCSSIIVVFTVYIQYKSELYKTFSQEADLLRTLYINLLFIYSEDILKMPIEYRLYWGDKLENNFRDLIHNLAEFSCMERCNRNAINKVVKDILSIYLPFIKNYKMYPGVALQLLRKEEYLDMIQENIQIMSKTKGDKRVAEIFVDNNRKESTK